MWLQCVRGLTCISSGAHGCGGPTEPRDLEGVGNKSPFSADKKGEQECVHMTSW
jgi:hypothetical protein